MEKEKNEKKKIKSITKKAKKIRSIVMMSLLCVLMLSAATYAWFTLSDTAKVSNLTMTVGDVTGLQIAVDYAAIPNSNKTGHGKYGNELKFGAEDTEAETYGITGTLLPATLISGGTAIQKPEYADDGSGSVIGLDDVITNNDEEVLKNGNDSSKTGYYYETTFYMLAGENLDVRLKAATGLDEDGIFDNDETGTYVLNKTKDDTNYLTHIGAKAVRIRLIAVDTDNSNNSCGTIIYRPNSDLEAGENTYTTAKDTRSNWTTEEPTDVQSKNGVFSKQGKIALVKDHDTKITMQIWIEGTDDFCGNEIKLEDIVAQLQFEEATTTP